MIFPDVVIAFRGALALVFLYPRQINTLDKIADGHNARGWNLPAVDSRHMFGGCVSDISGRLSAASGDRAEAVGHARRSDCPVNAAMFSIPDIPATTDFNDLTVLHLSPPLCCPTWLT